MKNGQRLMGMLIGCILSGACMGQQTGGTCSAAFLGNKMIVDQYTPTGKCSVPAQATGQLTVNTVHLSPTERKALTPILFNIAIRDKESQTLRLYSDRNYKQVNIRQVLAKCRKGDRIVLLTRNKQYTLPHNEILVR